MSDMQELETALKQDDPVWGIELQIQQRSSSGPSLLQLSITTIEEWREGHPDLTCHRHLPTLVSCYGAPG